MAIDKKQLQEMLAHYQAWNESKFATQVLQRGQSTPEQKWQAYQDLYAFAMQIKSGASLWEQVSTMEEWAFYLDQIRRFEKWRKLHGKIA